MRPFPLAVGLGECASRTLPPPGLPVVAFLCSLPDPREHSHARLEIGLCNLSQEFVTKFVGSCRDLRNYPLRAPTEQHHFATAIVWRISARDPSLPLKAVQ